MFKDIEGEGKISYSNSELADKINISEKSVIRYNNSLERKGYLTKVKANIKDLESGCCKEIKIFDLNKMLQQIVWILKNHEERITDNTNRIERLEQQVESLTKTNSLLLEENKKLKQTNQKYTM